MSLVFIDYDFGDVFPAVPSVPSTDWEGGTESSVTLFSCFAMFPRRACCMFQNQLLITFNNAHGHNDATAGVGVGGILQ